MAMGEGTKPQDYLGFYQYFDRFAWINQLNFGAPNFWVPHLFPFDAVFWLLRHLGLPFQLVQMGWGVFLWLPAAIGMYFFVSSIATKHRLVQIWGVLAALVYLFNPFTVQFPFNENLRLVYLALPFSLGLFVRGLRSQKIMPYAIGIGLVGLLYATAAVNPPTIATLWLAIGVLGLSGILFLRVSWWQTAKLFGWSLIWYVLLNSWWLLIMVPSALTVAGTAEEVMGFASPATALWESFRFLGSWGFRSSHQGVNYFSYNQLYYGQSWLITLSSYAVPAISLLALASKKRNKYMPLLATLLFVGLFLTKGIAAPFGGIYDWLWNNVPFLWVFREPYTKFTPLVIFSSAVLFGAVVVGMIAWLKERVIVLSGYRRIVMQLLSAGVIVIAIGLVVVSSWPLWSRQTPRQESQKALKSSYYQLPEYWQEAGAWFAANDPRSRVLLLPKSSYGDPYNWPPNGTATGGTAAKFLIPNPLITYRDALTESGRACNLLYGHITPEAPKDLIKILRFFGTRYILQLNDLDWQNTGVLSPAAIRQALVGQSGIWLARSFGEVDVYTTDSQIILPRIYAPNELYVVKNAVSLTESLMAIAPRLSLAGRPVVILVGEENSIFPADTPRQIVDANATEPIVPPLPLAAPDVEFSYLTPDHYHLKITNITQSFALRFSENFDPHWQFVPTPSSWWRKITQTLMPQPLLFAHSSANRGSNLWWADMAELERRGVLQPTGNNTWSAELELVFTLNAWLYWGFIISGVALLAAIGILIRWFVKQQRLANGQ